jgi:hypothetical protein
MKQATRRGKEVSGGSNGQTGRALRFVREDESTVQSLGGSDCWSDLSVKEGAHRRESCGFAGFVVLFHLRYFSFSSASDFI